MLIAQQDRGKLDNVFPSKDFTRNSLRDQPIVVVLFLFFWFLNIQKTNYCWLLIDANKKVFQSKVKRPLTPWRNGTGMDAMELETTEKITFPQIMCADGSEYVFFFWGLRSIENTLGSKLICYQTSRRRFTWGLVI